MKFSVIIPVLNESKIINSTIDHIFAIDKKNECEVIVVDGNPQKNTIKAINNKRVICLGSLKGRARQMNKGASVARGDILIFLHADTKLPENAFDKVAQAIENKKYVAGAFSLGIDSTNIILKFIAFTSNFRVHFSRVPYGDQAIFIRRDYFNEIGGYSNIPLMEDVDLMKRIKKHKKKIYIIRDRVMTSARRWKQYGIIYTNLMNHLVRTLYFLGVHPDKLVKLYYCEGGQYEKDSVVEG